MLQIKNIKKTYVTGDLEQKALDDVSFNLRDNEFVAILGPSGSGKTTLLNIIGGLDHYDEGDLIINGISTKNYSDRDWDSYRNHTIGFVFQSYNLIPHQTVLANVELALTISGISKAERKRRAQEALNRVGLGNQAHKKPNQMSGGQMQRVAIARALVNDPDILLADEPTGALDSETSVQVMDLLKEVADDRLVIMVTHNEELAEEYATRIINLKDGKVRGDTDPLEISLDEKEPVHKNMGKSSMSFLTALNLSFNNLKTKKGRTILTAFAGSIGIIGIALILSLSSGVNKYIDDIQRSTMLSYPVTIDAQTMDLSSLTSTDTGNDKNDGDAVYTNTTDLEMSGSLFSSVTENNLTPFKKYLEDKDSDIQQYLGDNGIVYSYDLSFNAYTRDPNDELVNTDGVLMEEDADSATYAATQMMESNPFMSSSMSSSTEVFSEMLSGTDGDLVGQAIKDNYNLVYGKWPEAYNEVVLILDSNSEIPSVAAYEIGLLPSSEYESYIDKMNDGEDVDITSSKIDYGDAWNKEIYMIPTCDFYKLNSEGYYENVGTDPNTIVDMLSDSIHLKITGIIKPEEGADYTLSGSIGYTRALTDYFIDHENNSDVVKAQEASPNVSVLNGLEFEPENSSSKAEDARKYIEELNVSDKAALFKKVMSSAYSGSSQISQIEEQGESAMAEMFDSYISSADDDTLVTIYDTYVSAGTYDENMQEFGVVSLDVPSSISIFADSFEDKEGITDCIDEYNKQADESNKITYTDYVGLLMSSVTTIVNVISYVLIAFVAVSLIVSSIMIGIITYISVLERTKEIGILRAIGASKKNISQVFNAETFIIGLLSGLIGVGVTLLTLIPANAIIHALTNDTSINAYLPGGSAIILILLALGLTVLGGLIPSRKAAKKDPVTALRTD